jgi:hypothetical protein
MKRQQLLARGLGIVELFVGVGAAFGGGALVAAPSGAFLGIPLEFLEGTPFRSYRIPGIVLFLVVGGGNLGAGVLSLRNHRLAAVASLSAGVALSGWIVTQMILIGYRHPIQVFYLGCGLLTAILALLLKQTRIR